MGSADLLTFLFGIDALLQIADTFAHFYNLHDNAYMRKEKGLLWLFKEGHSETLLKLRAPASG